MESILQYIQEKYQPEGLIVYGSFADGSNNQNSDFDGLVLTGQGEGHDASVVEGVQLDLFLYSPKHFAGEFDPEEVVQIFDGKILVDQNGQAADIQNRVREYLAAYQPKNRSLVERDVAWCRKMAGRCVRGDAEGFFRWHWLLTDSLEIYSDIMGQRYFGPKKALRAMESKDSASFALYRAALERMEEAALEGWIRRMEELIAAEREV